MNWTDSSDLVDHTGHPFVAMPLGGLGTGNLALGADGGLRQWQIHNIGNHLGDLPLSCFTLRVSCIEPPLDDVRLLQAPSPAHDPTSLINDDAIPAWQRDLVDSHGVESATFRAIYPEAVVEFRDDRLPLQVRMHAFNPMVPTDLETSSIPAAFVTFELTNTSEKNLFGWLGGSLLNAVGWDGITPIEGTSCSVLGGNTNRELVRSGWTSVVMENPSLPRDHEAAGQMLIATDCLSASTLTQFTGTSELLGYLGNLAMGTPLEQPHGDTAAQAHSRRAAVGPAPSGRSWAGLVTHRFDLAPGASATIRFLIAWSFPNRHVNFGQFGPDRPEWGSTRFWLGNHYSMTYPSAEAVLEHVTQHWSSLLDATRLWTNTLRESSLDAVALEHLAAQASYLRSPSVFRGADGTWFGFEGVLGASTRMWNGDVGGSCPLNCNHVWNYAQAGAALFPEIERGMRRTEFLIMQHPDGYIPHRLIAPTYLRQLWGVPIGGPDEPALDGMLGSILKVTREVQRGAGTSFLDELWPGVRRVLTYVQGNWDTQGDGVLHGVQPSTHDIDLCGANSFMGTLYLAALRAAEELSRRVGDSHFAVECRRRFSVSRSGYEDLFNGEYYEQRLDPDDDPAFQWGAGCLSDQLIGQWWAHELGLGHILDSAHVRTALESIVGYNFRESFEGFSHGYRTFAEGPESGLVICSWPRGGRPLIPTRYADEVWTGVEYQVAAHCLREDLSELSEKLTRAVWSRYDGRRRNPYNEIECGDHYVRAMAGWSLVGAAAGVHLSMDGNLVTSVDRVGRWPLVHSQGFGLLHRDGSSAELSDRIGRFSGHVDDKER